MMRLSFLVFRDNRDDFIRPNQRRSRDDLKPRGCFVFSIIHGHACARRLPKRQLEMLNADSLCR